MTSQPSTSRVELVTSTRQILEARGADEIVWATLHAARDLLQVDVVFWTDLHEGVLRLRTALGLHHPEALADYAVPINKGIGGRVAATNRPLIVRDYRHDPRRLHAVSRTLDAEGLTSALMVPIRRADSAVQGVLNVSSRAAREFIDEEGDLLMALAGLATVVMSHAERSQAMHRSLATSTATSRAQIAERRAQEAMVAALLSGEDVDVAVQAAGERLGVTFHLQPLGEPSPSIRSVISAEVPGGPWRLTAIDVAHRVTPETVARFAGVLGLHGSRERALLDVELRLSQQLIDALLSADEASLPQLERRAARLGIDLSARRVVVCVGPPQPVDRAFLDRLARTAQSVSAASLVTAHDELAVVLWPLDDARAAMPVEAGITEILDRLGSSEVSAGIGSICSRAADYGESIREAVFALETARHSTQPRRVAKADELGMYRVFAQVTRVSPLRKSIESTLGSLHDLDRQSGSQLVNTLRVYLEHDRRVAETARQLHIHVNTLRQRLIRISDTLSVDLDNPDTRFFLELALRLASLVGVPEPSRGLPR